MGGSSYMGIPREKIPWYPVIDKKKCIDCAACMNFCSNEVFAKTEEGIQVANPYQCVVGCRGCLKECSAGALTFPTNDELIAMLKTLREEFKQ